MTFYDDMQKVASDVLAEFGQEGLFLVKLIPGNGPEDDPGPSTKEPVKIDGSAKGVSFKYVQSGFASASDLQVTFSVKEGAEPEMKDFIRIGEVDHKILKILPKPATGVVVAYTVIVGS